LDDLPNDTYDLETVRQWASSGDLQTDTNIQVGVIEAREFMSAPNWLLTTSGLTGCQSALIYNRGYIQQMLFDQGGTIGIINLSGRLPAKALEELDEKCADKILLN